jgi:antitoxin CptB
MDAGQGERRVARLRFNCRRGMQELDLMLGAFILQHAEAISAGSWPQLEALLDSEDDQLWGWLQGRQQHPDQHLQALISAIRSGTPGAH